MPEKDKWINDPVPRTSWMRGRCDTEHPRFTRNYMLITADGIKLGPLSTKELILKYKIQPASYLKNGIISHKWKYKGKFKGWTLTKLLTPEYSNSKAMSNKCHEGIRR